MFMKAVTPKTGRKKICKTELRQVIISRTGIQATASFSSKKGKLPETN